MAAAFKSMNGEGSPKDPTHIQGGVILQNVASRLHETYCDTIGFEYMRIGSTQQYNWISKRVKHPNFLGCNAKKRVHVFEKLCFSNTFEIFLAGKFNTLKHFRVEGWEVVVLALTGVIESVSKLGARSFVIGMPHIRRLNVLANATRKLTATIFSKFQGTHYNTDYRMRGREDGGIVEGVKMGCYYCIV